MAWDLVTWNRVFKKIVTIIIKGHGHFLKSMGRHDDFLNLIG